MKFFKPEDGVEFDIAFGHWIRIEEANAKLEREGKIVFSQSSDRRYWEDPNDPTTQDASERGDLRALLINIEPIEKCTHPSEKVSGFLGDGEDIRWTCECGDRVKPKFVSMKSIEMVK